MRLCPTVNGAAKLLSLVGLTGLIWATLPTASLSAVTQSSLVQTVICDSTQGASLAVSSPSSDTIVSSPDLEIKGQVKQTSQIDVLVDGQYDQSVAIGASQTDFTLGLQLTPGTHTIKLTAIDRCQVGSDSKSIVVTYNQKANQGNGASTPTATAPPAKPTADGGVTITEPTDNAQKQSATGLGFMASFFRNLLSWLGLSATFSGNIAGTFLRILLIIIGSVMTVFGWAVLRPFKKSRAVLKALAYFEKSWALKQLLPRAIGMTLLIGAIVV